MKATYFDKDGKVTETKDFGEVVSDDALTYNDDQLFFEIPESIMKAARSKTDKLERLYLLDQLRFLIKYDFELYTKSEMCAKQEAELSCFLKECGCKDFEEFFGPQSYGYKPDNAYSTRRNELHSVLRMHQRSGMADIRHHLISVTKSNNIQYSRVVRNPQKINAWSGGDIIYSDELTPEIGFLMSLLAPLGDISEKQTLPGDIFKDNKFVLSVARALYRTKGIERSLLYNLLRLYLPAKKNVNQMQGTLSFINTEISTQENSFVIKNKNELGRTVCYIEIAKDELATMFSVSKDGNNILENIQGVLKLNFNIFLENSKKQVESALSQDVFLKYQLLDQQSWRMYLGVKYNSLRKEYEQNCTEDNLYATPFFLYGIILEVDCPNVITEITSSLTKDVIFACTRSKDNDLIPFYRVIYSLNHIKSQAGLIEDSNSVVSSEAIDNAIKYIEPIANVTFLSPKTTPEEFKELFRRILCAEPLNELIEDPTLKKPFNLIMLLNIIGLLINKGYLDKNYKKIDQELCKGNLNIFEDKIIERRAYISNYKTKNDSKSYILNKDLITTIESIINNYANPKNK